MNVCTHTRQFFSLRKSLQHDARGSVRASKSILVIKKYTDGQTMPTFETSIHISVFRFHFSTHLHARNSRSWVLMMMTSNRNADMLFRRVLWLPVRYLCFPFLFPPDIPGYFAILRHSSMNFFSLTLKFVFVSSLTFQYISFVALSMVSL